MQRGSDRLDILVLMNMVTRESHRGRGAAGMLINWGAKQAEAESVPASLEASVLGKACVHEIRLQGGGRKLATVI